MSHHTKQCECRERQTLAQLRNGSSQGRQGCGPTSTPLSDPGDRYLPQDSKTIENSCCVKPLKWERLFGPSHETNKDIRKENIRVLMRLQGLLASPFLLFPISSRGNTWLCSELPIWPLFYAFTHMAILWKELFWS